MTIETSLRNAKTRFRGLCFAFFLVAGAYTAAYILVAKVTIKIMTTILFGVMPLGLGFLGIFGVAFAWGVGILAVRMLWHMLLHIGDERRYIKELQARLAQQNVDG